MDKSARPREVWDELCRGAGFEPALAHELWGQIEEAYRQPHRRYHNLRHLEQVLASLGAFGPPLAEHPAAAWAAIYHDVVYEPLLPGNEAKSADWAAADLARLGASATLIEEVRGLILATANHLQVEAQGDLATFLDCDLLILASTPEEYDQYRKAIRAEYQEVPDELFRTGRRAVLERFLAAPCIYRTPRIHELHEAQARRNLERELGEP